LLHQRGGSRGLLPCPTRRSSDLAVAVITGSGGLIGSEAAAFFGELGMDVVGIDNDMRRVFFGDEASTAWNVARLQARLRARYAQDRKSTRLNSSHVKISYAVFCW